MILQRSARVALGCAIVVAVLAAFSPARAVPSQDREQVRHDMAALAWQRGPGEGQIGGVATIKLAEAQAFLDGPNTRRFLELNQNPPRDHHYTLAAMESGWFAIFYFESSGYVKDDEKLDPDALLTALRESDTPSNEERQRLGMPPIHTVGWHVPPHYDLASKRLEWGVRLRGDGGGDIVNYTIRLLGRRGVMHATLVSAPARLDRDIAEFKATLTGYGFASGERYAEFRAGDRVAEYGLAALVLGGAAAVATKTGFGKAIGKFVVVGVAAFGSAVVAFFRRLTRRG
jgi:uncharacterized membrane-anchored protein